mmetsp:Transcript_6804/g.10778  ORF Transcript_6804/g.10778 Transcript_6804/m.10778 type:complete len:307 (-) Transcript_6804:248-1168(-)
MIETAGQVELRPLNEGGGAVEAVTDLGVNESNHRLYCYGKCITGPAEEFGDLQKGFIGAYVVTAVVFTTVCGWLLGPHYPGLVVLPILYLVLDFVAFLLCACTDPGVVNPQPDLDTPYDASRRFCRSCNIYQEDGCRHCVFCNACIRELDHHCGITGTCIGARNKVHFVFLIYLYLWSMLSLIIAAVFTALCHQYSLRDTFDGTFPAGIDTAAKVIIIVESVVLGVVVLFYFLAVFGIWNKTFAGFVFKFCCLIPPTRSGDNLLFTKLARDPLCATESSLLANTFTYPTREFYPNYTRPECQNTEV